MSDSPTIVYVVDDDEAVGQAARYLLESVGLMVQTFTSGQAFLDAHDGDSRGCLLVDVRMPGISGLELQERLKARHCTLPTIVITGHADVPMAVRAMRAGAIDFLEKPFSDQILLDRIQQAIELSARRQAEREVFETVAARLERLTARERTVLEMVVSGKANKTIAAKLGVTPKTVEAHRAKVMKKTEADSLAGLVQMAMTYERGVEVGVIEPKVPLSEEAMPRV
jgi:FixJ family two-component response regulator